MIKEERVFEVEGVKVCWPVMELKKGRVYTINGRWAGKMLKDMVDGFATKSKVGYV